MKILLFSNTSWNLYNFRFHLIETLVASGHDVHLLAPPDEFTHYLQSAGFQWQPFYLSRKGMNPFQELWTIIKLTRTIREIQPDLVFNFTPKCTLYGSFVSKFLGVKKIVNTISGLGYLFSGEEFNFRLIQEVIRYLYFFALARTRVIFQNPEDLKDFIRRKIINEKQGFLVSGSGVNIEHFVPVDEPAGVPLVILPARLIKEKGALEFVEAAHIIHAKNIPARFALVGQIDQANPSAIPESQINRWVQDGVVEWWGWRSDMDRVLQQCHLVCLPTYYREGTPKSLIEAAACEKAIIASNVPGCKEIVRHNENGLMVEPRNSVQLANAIQKLLQDPALRKKMGKAGRHLVEREFQNQVITAKILKVAEL